ncbi:hypothetical protein ACET3Z_030277 [Daucus carota]
MYLLVITLEIPHLSIGFVDNVFVDRSFHRSPKRHVKSVKRVSGLVLDENGFVGIEKNRNFSELVEMAREAIVVGKKKWEDIVAGKVKIKKKGNGTVECPKSLLLSELEFRKKGGMVLMQCGLGVGSYISVVGKPRKAHLEKNPKIGAKRGEERAMVSQFVIELQGLKVVDGEEPPKILHYNPRLRGDWSGDQVIEQNTCYRKQWGASLRCVGTKSKASEETVDGQVKCENWIQRHGNLSQKANTSWWRNRLKKLIDKIYRKRPFPFVEDKIFVLTLYAGMEGFHVSVDGRHVSSFPYRPGFTLEDATGLSIKEDVSVHSVFATSLPTSHPSFAPLGLLEMVPKWKAPPLFDSPVEFFIGIISAGNHFAERMAVRKSWMQHKSIKSSNVVARFFVAMHKKKDVNAVLMKEAHYFGDIVVVPYMDNYDLVVLKTLAICEYGVRTVAAKYIMKCDDDTFVRLDAVVKEVKKAREDKSLYLGNINYNFKPFRRGKWAVTYEEWPELSYPPYANGPGYIISSDIASYVLSRFEKHKLRLFKMEDVSMGMWVNKFNKSRPVDYVHNLKFCQFGCIEDYFTAHYQTPRQMACLWAKLKHRGKPQCCNTRLDL